MTASSFGYDAPHRGLTSYTILLDSTFSLGAWHLGSPTADAAQDCGDPAVGLADLLGSPSRVASLHALRVRSGLSLGELAERVHVSKATLSRWESGQVTRTPGRAVLVLLAESLGVTVDDVEGAFGRAPLGLSVEAHADVGAPRHRKSMLKRGAAQAILMVKSPAVVCWSSRTMLARMLTGIQSPSVDASRRVAWAWPLLRLADSFSAAA